MRADLYLIVISTKSMHYWIIRGLNVGRNYEASVLNKLRGFQDVHTFPGKTVRRFDADVKMEDIDVSDFFSFSSTIRATKNMKKKEICQLLEDMSVLNTKNASSLIDVEVGSKVCVCVVNRVRTG